MVVVRGVFLALLFLLHPMTCVPKGTLPPPSPGVLVWVMGGGGVTRIISQCSSRHGVCAHAQWDTKT